MLSVLHLTALSRSALPIEQRRPVQFYCDEAHRFGVDALEDIVTQDRKYEVGLTLAHQYLSQFSPARRDALASVGATIIFNVDTRDAGYLRKDLQDMVEVKDLISLDVGEAIARIGTEVVRFRTLPPLKVPERHFRERIIEESHRRYYSPIADVRAARRGAGRRLREPSPSPFLGQEIAYDEL